MFEYLKHVFFLAEKHVFFIKTVEDMTLLVAFQSQLCTRLLSCRSLCTRSTGLFHQLQYQF